MSSGLFRLAGAWVRNATHAFDGVPAVSATLSPFGGPVDTDGTVDGGEERPEWDGSLGENRRDALDVGDSVGFSKRFTDDDVRAFAAASGDTNPLHLDEEYAAQTRFHSRIVHGTLVSGVISAALARLPGVVVYLSQDLDFRNPVGIGDRVTADCEVVEELDDTRYRLHTTVTTAGGEIAIDGEAVVLLDEP